MALQEEIPISNRRLDGLGLAALPPSAARVKQIDGRLRSQLSDSFCHIADSVDLGDEEEAKLRRLASRLRDASVSPWVFCLYSKLVAQLSNNERDVAKATVSDMVAAISLPHAAGIVPLRDSTAPGSWWDHLQVLFDTDSERPFTPEMPSAEAFVRCKGEVEAGLALFKIADPDWYNELKCLLRMIVLGSARLDADDLFNGASTYFFWGGNLLNVEIRRNAVSIIDLLVHETSHMLLFGLSAEGALLLNSGEERYTSPFRADPRPIDGILHACFVASRVNLAMTRLLDSGALTDENERRAAERRKLSADAGRVGLEVLDKHARPSEHGLNVLQTLHSYWNSAT